MYSCRESRTRTTRVSKGKVNGERRDGHRCTWITIVLGREQTDLNCATTMHADCRLFVCTYGIDGTYKCGARIRFRIEVNGDDAIAADAQHKTYGNDFICFERCLWGWGRAHKLCRRGFRLCSSWRNSWSLSIGLSESERTTKVNSMNIYGRASARYWYFGCIGPPNLRARFFVVAHVLLQFAASSFSSYSLFVVFFLLPKSIYIYLHLFVSHRADHDFSILVILVLVLACSASSSSLFFELAIFTI